MQRAAVFILHYGKTSETITCINSLLNLNLSGIELSTFVLDNSSHEKLEIEVNKYSKIDLSLLHNKYNAGFTGGHNLIYEKVQDSDFQYFLLLNNDCILEKECIVNLLEAAEKDEKIGGVVPKIYFTKGREFHKDRYSEKQKGKVLWYAGGIVDWENVQSKHIGVDEVDKGQFEDKKEVDFATGACFLLKAEVIRKIGLFDEKYFLYFEDADLSQRIIRRGFKLIYQPKAVVWHNNAGSSGSGSELHDYYLTRNRMLFGMKYAPLRIKLHLLKESLRLLTTGRKWQRIGIRDYYIRKFGKGSY